MKGSPRKYVDRKCLLCSRKFVLMKEMLQKYAYIYISVCVCVCVCVCVMKKLTFESKYTYFISYKNIVICMLYHKANLSCSNVGQL